ncbi:MAG: zinc ribbon domain-containing protein [Bacteroidaceae bacterium]|nr:zinc ribbon domain-containing protein [Bacteroidaceae bacterium]
MYCEKCGKYINDDAIFCSECGALVWNFPSDSPFGHSQRDEKQPKRRTPE